MKSRKVICLMTAVLMSLCTGFGAFAEKSDSKAEEFKIDEKNTTTTQNEPALSFDMSDWSNYVESTPDSSKINLKLKQEKSNSYQGGTLKITGSTKTDITEFPTFAWKVQDANANYLYPKAKEKDAKHITMGAEIDAKDFGMNCFDGCLITFIYRIDESVKGKLMDDSVYVFPTDDKYNTLDSKELKMKYNDADNNNVKQYAKGIIQIAPNVGATKLIFETPIIKACEETDILFVDNIQITTPLWVDGKEVYVKNIDGYNSNAEILENVDDFPTYTNVDEDSNTSSETEVSNVTKTSIFIYIGAGVLGVGVIVFIIIMIKRIRNRFY